MIPRIQKILYATDLSANSAYAFGYAINSAIKHDANIIILHVFEQVLYTNRSLLEFYLTEEQCKSIFEERSTETIERIRKRLKTFCDQKLKDYPEAEKRVVAVEVCEGFPAEVILRKAEELSCDAVVMGTHGKDIIKHTFFGSTAKRVLRRTRKSVFIVPLPKGEIDITIHDE